MTVCHYTRNTIGCPSGLVIKINSAFWGRRDKKTCTYVSVQPCGVKGIPVITKNLQKKCDHYVSCNLHASESESYLDHSCPTVHKYLQVNYTCTKGNSFFISSYEMIYDICHFACTEQELYTATKMIFSTGRAPGSSLNITK